MIQSPACISIIFLCIFIGKLQRMNSLYSIYATGRTRSSTRPGAPAPFDREGTVTMQSTKEGMMRMRRPDQAEASAAASSSHGVDLGGDIVQEPMLLVHYTLQGINTLFRAHLFGDELDTTGQIWCSTSQFFFFSHEAVNNSVPTRQETRVFFNVLPGVRCMRPAHSFSRHISIIADASFHVQGGLAIDVVLPEGSVCTVDNMDFQPWITASGSDLYEFCINMSNILNWYHGYQKMIVECVRQRRDDLDLLMNAVSFYEGEEGSLEFVQRALHSLGHLRGSDGRVVSAWTSLDVDDETGSIFGFSDFSPCSNRVLNVNFDTLRRLMCPLLTIKP